MTYHFLIRYWLGELVDGHLLFQCVLGSNYANNIELHYEFVKQACLDYLHSRHKVEDITVQEIKMLDWKAQERGLITELVI